jgi:hypothetical protein
MCKESPSEQITPTQGNLSERWWASGTATVRRFALLVTPFLVLALYRVDSGRLLGYHHFRQAHTSLAARNYAFYDANLLHPTIDGVTYGKDLYLNEFPLYPYLVGALWRVFGEHLVLARLLSIGFTLLALWCYHRLLLRLLADRLVADLALLAMSLTPVVSYFGRCVERQSLFLFLLIMGSHWLVVYIEERKPLALLPAALGLSVAILLNPFAVYMALPLGWYTIRLRGSRALLDWRLYAVAVCAVVPALTWYGYAVVASRSLPTGGMLAMHEHRNFVSLEHYAMWLHLSHWERMLKTILRFVVPSLPAFLVCLYGVAKSPRQTAYGFFRVWFLAVVVYLLIDFYPAAVVVHEYYYINLVPMTSLFFVYGLLHLGRTLWASAVQVTGRDQDGWNLRIRAERRPAEWLKAALLVLAAGWFPLDALSGNRVMHKADWHHEYYVLQEKLPQRIPEGARVTVVAESDDPLFSYLLAPRMTHRLLTYRPSRLVQILSQQDFDFLAISWDTPQFPLDEIISAIECSGCLGKPLLQTQNLILFPRRVSASGRQR